MDVFRNPIVVKGALFWKEYQVDPSSKIYFMDNECFWMFFENPRSL
jgi:hypothetical protein